MSARRSVFPYPFAFALVVIGCGASDDASPPAAPGDAGRDAEAPHDAARHDAAPETPPATDGGDDADARRPSPCDGLPPRTWTVNVTDDGFVPPAQAICPGDTVTWIWKGGWNSVTSGGWCQPDDLFGSGWHDAPHSYSHTFKEPAGLFMYYDEADCQNLTGAILIVR